MCLFLMHAVLLNFLEKKDPQKCIAVSTNILGSFNMDTNKKYFSNEWFSKWLGNIEDGRLLKIQLSHHRD